MKRKVTELEQKLINDGWCLTTKRYTGKHSQKILCYEYHKTSDLRNDNKTYDLFIQLDQKRSHIVKYGITNLFIEKMGYDELLVVRFLFLELRHYVERVIGKREPRQIDPLLNKPTKIIVKDISDEEKKKLIKSLNEPGKIVIVPNSELDERQELGAMTPEQFDELCKEHE